MASGCTAPPSLSAALSAALAGADTVEAVCTSALGALHTAGAIRCGTIHACSVTPGTFTIGGEATPHEACEPVPTQYVIGVSLHLELLDAAQLDQPAIAFLLGSALDRVALADQVHALRREARRRLRDVAAIHEVTREVQRSDSRHMLEALTERTGKLLRADTCSLMLLDADNETLRIHASWGLPADVVAAAARALGEGIAGRVARSGEPLLVPSETSDQRLDGISLRPEVQSSMVAPIKDEKGHVSGVLSVRRNRPAAEFTEDDLRLFIIFAAQMALAISNKQLEDNHRRRVRELSTLADIAQAVTTHLDVDRLLEIVADAIVDVVKLNRCCILLLDRSTRRFVPRVMRGYRAEMFGSAGVRSSEGVLGLVARRQAPLLVPDSRSASQPMRGFARSLGTDSFVAAPMTARGQTIGIVVADNRLSGHRIRPNNVELLGTLINQAGVALENAQLNEDREQRFQEIHRLATQTDNIVRSIAASVVVVGIDETITRWNTASEDLWGLHEADVLGRPVPSVLEAAGVHAAEVAYLLQTLRTVVTSRTPHQALSTHMHTRARGEVCANILVSPVLGRQHEPQGAVMVVEDVTRDVSLASEMERMRRLADLGQLAAKVAHEVRNPLSSIKGAAQLMRTRRGDAARVDEFLDIIIDEVNGLNRLTSDLLTFARPVHIDLRPTNLNRLLERTLQLLADQVFASNIKAVLVADPDQPEIVADPNQVQQVLRNVILNAVQAMPEGGTLTLSTEQAPGMQSVDFVCADTGVGIPADKLETIFTPFYTTKSKGTGLGLCVVRRIVEMHGGTIEVHSLPGTGTEVRVRLPLQAVQPPEPGLDPPEPKGLLPDRLPDE